MRPLQTPAWPTTFPRPYGPRHRRRLPGARREPFRAGRARSEPHPRPHEGRGSPRENEEQAGRDQPARDRRGQGSFPPELARRRERVGAAAASPALRAVSARRGARKARRTVDRELSAGSAAHYADPAYYTKTYQK